MRERSSSLLLLVKDGLPSAPASTSSLNLALTLGQGCTASCCTVRCRETSLCSVYSSAAPVTPSQSSSTTSPCLLFGLCARQSSSAPLHFFPPPAKCLPDATAKRRIDAHAPHYVCPHVITAQTVAVKWHKQLGMTFSPGSG